MSDARVLITVTDNLSATSMPFNEFVLYRRIHYPEEKQVVFLLFKTKADESVEIPEDVKVYFIGKRKVLLGEAMKDVMEIAKQKKASLAIHIHEAKSVLFFNWATDNQFWKQIVYTLHSTYKNYSFHNKLFCLCASMLCRQVVCVSGTSLKYYPRLLKWILGDKVMVIPNGVDVERIDKIGGENKVGIIAHPQFTAIYVARLVALKRHKILMDAIKALPDVKLLLIGTGPLDRELRQYAERKGIKERVEFMGLLPREDVYQELKKADLYVSASSYEGLPIGVLEAMCCGTPCLVSNIEQHREIKEQAHSLITCDDAPECWTEKMSLLSKMGHKQLCEIGDINRKGVKKSFSLEEMHKKYDVVYALCMKKSKTKVRFPYSKVNERSL